MESTENTEEAQIEEPQLEEVDAAPYGERRAEELCIKLRKRADKLSNAALVAILLMASAMAGGFSLFYYAGEIVARENLDSFHRASGIRNSLHTTNISMKEMAKNIDAKEDDELRAEFKKLDSRITSLNEKAEKIEVVLPAEQSEKIELNRQISLFSMITRVTAGFVLVFLVQILIKMYRYNVRLSAFYEGRADALDLAADQSPSSVERAAKFLSPDAIDFGEIPEPPSKQAVEILKQVSGIVKKETKKS